MSLLANGVPVEKVLANGQVVDKVMANGVVVWENWKERTGEIGYVSSSANNSWGDSGYLDLGKEIIPLEGTIYFSWSMSGGSSSTSMGASYGGKGVDGREVTFFSHSKDSMGANGSGSSTESKTVSANAQIPIRYVKCSCGGGTGGGSTRYSVNAKITKWLER